MLTQSQSVAPAGSYQYNFGPALNGCWKPCSHTVYQNPAVNTAHVVWLRPGEAKGPSVLYRGFNRNALINATL